MKLIKKINALIWLIPFLLTFLTFFNFNLLSINNDFSNFNIFNINLGNDLFNLLIPYIYTFLLYCFLTLLDFLISILRGELWRK